MKNILKKLTIAMIILAATNLNSLKTTFATSTSTSENTNDAAETEENVASNTETTTPITSESTNAESTTTSTPKYSNYKSVTDEDASNSTLSEYRNKILGEDLPKVEQNYIDDTNLKLNNYKTNTLENEENVTSNTKTTDDVVTSSTPSITETSNTGSITSTPAKSATASDSTKQYKKPTIPRYTSYDRLKDTEDILNSNFRSSSYKKGALEDDFSKVGKGYKDDSDLFNSSNKTFEQINRNIVKNINNLEKNFVDLFNNQLSALDKAFEPLLSTQLTNPTNFNNNATAVKTKRNTSTVIDKDGNEKTITKTVTENKNVYPTNTGGTEEISTKTIENRIKTENPNKTTNTNLLAQEPNVENNNQFNNSSTSSNVEETSSNLEETVE